MEHSQFYTPSCFLIPGFTEFATNDVLDVSIDDPYEERATEFRDKLRLGRYAERQVAFKLNEAAKQHSERVWLPPFSQHGYNPTKSRDVFATKNGRTYAIEVKTNDELLQPYTATLVDNCDDYNAKCKTTKGFGFIPLCTVVVGSQADSGEYPMVVIPDSTIDKWKVLSTKNRRKYLAYRSDISCWKTFTQLQEWLYPTHETEFGR